MFNLLSNAVKFTEEGSIAVTMNGVKITITMHLLLTSLIMKWLS